MQFRHETDAAEAVLGIITRLHMASPSNKLLSVLYGVALLLSALRQHHDVICSQCQ
jgi:hypothetical protein